MTTTTRSDSDLLALATGGDADALRALVERHLHPAWRIAVVTAGDQARAEAATVDGFVAALVAAERQPDVALATTGLRIRVVASARQAAIASASSSVAPSTSDDPVVAAFLALPEKSRTALWLTEVEGGTPEQVAPVLGLDRSAAAALADRAALALRERLAANVAARAADDCRTALAKLPAHAAGKLTAAERAKVGEHVGGCGACAVWLAALVSPRPALRRLVPTPPQTLAAEIEARWFEHLDRDKAGWLAPFTERAIGAAAAAVLAIGLAGVAFLGDPDDGRADRRSELAIPASADPKNDPATGSTVEEIAAPPVPVVATPMTTATPTTPTTAPPAPPTTRPRSVDDPPPQQPSPPVDPTPIPPPPPVPEPTPDDDALQVSVQALQGLVALGVGDCTGLAIAELHVGCVPPSSAAPLSITIDLPGLDPIGI